MDTQGLPAPAVRVVEAVLIAALTRLFGEAVDHAKARRGKRRSQEERIAELEKELAELKLKGKGDVAGE